MNAHICMHNEHVSISNLTATFKVAYDTCKSDLAGNVYYRAALTNILIEG